MRTCPACTERIERDVLACPHCGVSLHSYATGGDPGSEPHPVTTAVLVLALLAALVGTVAGVIVLLL